MLCDDTFLADSLVLQAQNHEINSSHEEYVQQIEHSLTSQHLGDHDPLSLPNRTTSTSEPEPENIQVRPQHQIVLSLHDIKHEDADARVTHDLQGSEQQALASNFNSSVTNTITVTTSARSNEIASQAASSDLVGVPSQFIKILRRCLNEQYFFYPPSPHMSQCNLTNLMEQEKKVEDQQLEILLLREELKQAQQRLNQLQKDQAKKIQEDKQKYEKQRRDELRKLEEVSQFKQAISKRDSELKTKEARIQVSKRGSYKYASVCMWYLYS